MNLLNLVSACLTSKAKIEGIAILVGRAILATPKLRFRTRDQEIKRRKINLQQQLRYDLSLSRFHLG